MASIKISILLFYYRLFNSDPRFRIAVWVMATVVMCWYITSTLIAIFQCSPIPYNWDRTIPGGQCLSTYALWIGNSVSSLATDVAILCLPLPIIWRMDVTPRQKTAISGMFLLGAWYVSNRVQPICLFPPKAHRNESLLTRLALFF